MNLNNKTFFFQLFYMEDDGGQYFISPVDAEIKDAMHRVIAYFEKAHNVKAKRLHFPKMKKSLGYWFARMSGGNGKDFSYELSNRTGRVKIWWEFIKWVLHVGDHTFVALLTVAFENFGVSRGSEAHTKLMQEGKELIREFKVIDFGFVSHFT